MKLSLVYKGAEDDIKKVLSSRKGLEGGSVNSDDNRSNVRSGEMQIKREEFSPKG